MVYPTFNPHCSDSGTDRRRQPRMIENQFGDGYEQVSQDGINNNFEDLSPKWTNATKSEGEYILDFLNGRAGLPFYYQHNKQGPIRVFRCTDLNDRQKKGDYYDITATFKRMATI